MGNDLFCFSLCLYCDFDWSLSEKCREQCFASFDWCYFWKIFLTGPMLQELVAVELAEVVGRELLQNALAAKV